MGEVKTYTFDHREVAEALIKKENVHEGLWGIYVEFGIAGANVAFGIGSGRPSVSVMPDDDNIVPAAVVPVLKLGIQRFEKPNRLTVDAAQVNPNPNVGDSSEKGEHMEIVER